jgi:hypothetical protein
MAMLGELVGFWLMAFVVVLVVRVLSCWYAATMERYHGAELSGGECAVVAAVWAGLGTLIVAVWRAIG